MLTYADVCWEQCNTVLFVGGDVPLPPITLESCIGVEIVMGPRSMVCVGRGGGEGGAGRGGGVYVIWHT